MRAFVALEIGNAGVIDSLVEAQKRLAGTGADLKLVERENLHFTVRFLGEISARDAAEVDSRLKALSLAGGDAQVSGIGAFPNVARPRVLWSGVAPPGDALVTSIARSVQESLAGIGLPEEGVFRPHVTIARVRSARNSERLATVLRSSASSPFGTATLSSLKLKSSVLTPAGPVYTDLGAYPLA